MSVVSNKGEHKKPSFYFRSTPGVGIVTE